MSKYSLRFFFDGVCGDCLWAGNEITTTTYGYPIQIGALPLPQDVVAFGNELVDRYTKFAAQANIWPEGDSETNFQLSSQKFLRLLRVFLPTEFVVIDESGLT